MPTPELIEAMGRLLAFVRGEGRDPASFSITPRLAVTSDSTDWIGTARDLQGAGATDIALGTPPSVQGPEALETVIKAKETLAKELG